MIFQLSFFIFSLFISYIDCTKRRIPNVMILTLFFLLTIFGYLENQLNYYSFIVSLLVLVFFIIILLILPNQILGGGDIKYMVVIGIYLEPVMFPLFLLTTGLMQLLFLLYFQKIRKRRTAPMAPAMFFSVIVVKLNEMIGCLTF